MSMSEGAKWEMDRAREGERIIDKVGKENVDIE